MKQGDFIFVYGTLMRGERADITKKGVFNVQLFNTRAQINGHLYHLGAFPGLKFLDENSGEEEFIPGLPVVHGEVYLIGDPSVGAVLDAYEGYHADAPESGLYNRKQVFTAKGRLVWVYIYNGPVFDEQLIETGDWRNPRLASTRRVPIIGRN